MTLNTGPTIFGTLLPVDDQDTYPTHQEKFGLGGYRSTSNHANRDAIPVERRKEGMLVRTNDDRIIWVLEDDLVTWTELTLSGGGGGGPMLATAEEAARLLEQTSFGPTHDAITHVQTVGVTAYIDEQLAMGATGYPVAPADQNAGYPAISGQPGTGCPGGGPGENSPERVACLTFNYGPLMLQNQFYRNACYGPDQLRQRVAFALSQIFVISAQVIDPKYALRNFQQKLLDYAFGNFRDLIGATTLDPAMAKYLDMAKSDAAEKNGGILPNENFARETLQLFSIGLTMLNADGSEVTSGGIRVAAFSSAQVQAFSRVFTGWTYPTSPERLAPGGGGPSFYNNPPYFDGQMIPFNTHYDRGAKTLLNGTVLPAHSLPLAGNEITVDLALALDNICAHSNVGPFIGKQLIQHLVTSNPTPAYVARITAVWNNDGMGVRGNLRAVVRAILMDSEARGDVKTDTSYGKLRDPVLLATSVVRGIGGNTDGRYPNRADDGMGQDVYSPDSVFSYYSSDFPLAGTALVGPSFGIFDAATNFNRTNFLNTILTGPIPGQVDTPPISGVTPGTALDLTAWRSLASNPDALLARINRVFFHGAMSPAVRNRILTRVNAISTTDLDKRAKVALYLSLSSAQYQVEQ